MTAQGKGPVAPASNDLFNPLPREKLKAMGASALTDAEVLALLLRTGTPERPVVAFATDILSRLGGLRGLLQATPERLGAIKGLGPAKQAEIAAVSELVNRAMRETLQARSVLRDPADVRQYLQMQLGGKTKEVFAVLFLNTQYHLLAMEELFQGTLTQATVYPREVAVAALRHHAAAVILAHNHPSGHGEPSSADIHLTETLTRTLQLIDVRVLDHMVVTAGGVYSMAEHGLI
jgi:DNA repair protein RadC